MSEAVQSHFPTGASSLAAALSNLFPRRSVLLPAALALIAAWSLWTMPVDLNPKGRIVLIVTALAIIGWVGTRLPESVVALTAALALVLAGAVPEERLYETLGSDLVWLLLAAFVIAAVLKDSGLTDRMVAPLTASRPRFVMLVGALTGMITLTAFVLPSTSGRAALLLPVFLALIPALPDARLRLALALLFPTVILLSAGGSLIGAGAHLIAVEAIAGTTGLQIGFVDWIVLGAPLAALASIAGTALILLLFVPRSLWWVRVEAVRPTGPRTVQQKRIAFIIVTLVSLWMTESLHGLGMAIVAVIGAVVLLTKPFTTKKPKELFRAVDVELILYMAATMLIARAMIDTGADKWLAGQAIAVMPERLARHGVALAVMLSVVAVLTHLFITSRSARAAVLIPAVALPLSGLGHDPALLVLIAVMGTGFCQTMMASAKPVAIYGQREEAGFTSADLLRLALPLAPVKVLLLVGFAVTVWPHQLAALRGAAPVAAEVNIIAPSPGLRTAIASASKAQLLDAQVLLPAMRRVLTSWSAGENWSPALAMEISPLPRHRPENLGTHIEVASKSTKTKTKKAAPVSLPRKIKADLKQVSRQFRSDLRSLFN
jgi:solute carrier family 13 (sodium-dependent dicarboxylate transporter), member 2/3/5